MKAEVDPRGRAGMEGMDDGRKEGSERERRRAGTRDGELRIDEDFRARTHATCKRGERRAFAPSYIAFSLSSIPEVKFSSPAPSILLHQNFTNEQPLSRVTTTARTAAPELPSPSLPPVVSYHRPQLIDLSKIEGESQSVWVWAATAAAS